jgi:hypothetical protein
MVKQQIQAALQADCLTKTKLKKLNLAYNQSMASIALKTTP